jgi:hypothetical protein
VPSMLSVGLLGAAAVFVLLGAVVLRRARAGRAAGDAFLAGSRGTWARVVDLHEKYPPRPDASSMPTYFPVVSFVLPDGREVEGEVMIGGRPAPARVGSTVEVRYDPDDPHRVVLAHGMATVGGLGCFATGLAVALWIVAAVALAVWTLLVLVLRVPA